MAGSYAFEVGDKLSIGGLTYLVAGFRKMIGMPIEYCLRTAPSSEILEMWMTVPEIDAWLDTELV